MKNIKGKVIMLIGLLFIAIALFWTLFNILESKSAEYYSESVVKVMEEYVPNSAHVDYEELDEGILSVFLNKNMSVIEIDGDKYIGYLYIPDIDLKLPVLQDYIEEDLKKAPCRYSGSVYTGDIVIAGHNYRSHFSRIRSLSLGTTVQFIDVEGNVFNYIVVDIEVLNGEAVDAMQQGQWDMTLFTCNYDGQKRVTLRCELDSISMCTE